MLFLMTFELVRILFLVQSMADLFGFLSRQLKSVLELASLIEIKPKMQLLKKTYWSRWVGPKFISKEL